jgi:threonine dehydrogenase-like Zn-dependent dehydrogenase
LYKAIVNDGSRTTMTYRRRVDRLPGWLRLRVLLAAVCRTDIYAARGRLPLGGPRVLGHEMVGEVIDADPSSRFGPDDRVTVAPLVACEACKRCVNGMRCSSPRMLGVALDGAFSEEVLVPEAAAFRVPADLDLRRAAMVEPVAATIAVLRAPISPEMSGAVIGDGRLADLAVRVLHGQGFNVHGGQEIDRVGLGTLDYVVDAAGSDQSVARALELVRPGGCVVFKSRPWRPIHVDLTVAVHNDITITSIGYGSFGEAVQAAGRLPMDDLFGETYPLERFDEVMSSAHRDPLGPKIFLSPAESS